ncbi:Protein transport protein yip1 [Cladophialophora carrionii]|uniref:Protein transport protein yip1 n=1 Tax=Cladophialophora carrionii TaxID=86049 RepID=A0A1C1CR88_9EURO|nr:Protein transport protein yip1 [Cladophialophora carrionii]
MSYYNQPYGPGAGSGGGAGAANLQFYPSSYSNVSGHTTPSQASYGGYGGSGNAANAFSAYGTGSSGAFGAGPGLQGVSGRMGDSSGGLRMGWLAAFGTEGYEGEPGLMEELGVNFGHIKTKTLTVLNPWTRPSPHIMDDSDLYGGLLFLVLYGTFLALSGKFFYGYIYGIALFGSFALHWMFALMTPPIDPSDSDQMSQAQRDHHQGRDGHGGGHFSSTLTYSRSASVLGYCFLPLVFTALFGVAVPMDTAMGYVLTAMAVGWCTFSSSGMFVSVGRMKGMRGLVAYPLALFYLGFGIMGIFSSRGSGMLQGSVGS